MELIQRNRVTGDRVAWHTGTKEELQETGEEAGTLAHNPEAKSSPTVIIIMDRTVQPYWVSYINCSIKYRLVFCTGDLKMFLGKI